MQTYLEHSEELQVGISELKEQLETAEETGFTIMQIAKQARKEGGPRALRDFQSREKIRFTSASSARCVNPEGESRHGQVRAKVVRKDRENQTKMEEKGRWEGTW